MTSREIFDRVDEVIRRKGIVRSELSKESGMVEDAISRCVRRGGARLYTALDVLDAVGLELQFDNKPIRSHQELIDYINNRNPVTQRLSRQTGISQGTIKSLRYGENLSFDKALRIIDALGIEVRVV